MNLLTQDTATCCRCDKKYTIDQIPDSGICPGCELIEDEMADLKERFDSMMHDTPETITTLLAIGFKPTEAI